MDSNKILLEIYEMLTLVTPMNYTTTTLSENLGVRKETITAHLNAHYRVGVDYFQEVKRGTIIIPRKTAVKIKKYYMGSL